MTEIDDAEFERAYQRMMFRRNQETLRREIYGDPVPEGDHWQGAQYPTVTRPTWRVRLLAAQMQAELDERRLAEVVRDHIREYGAAWHDAARTAWAELEAAAPEGREPTKEQVAAFLARFGREWKEGKR